jgi:hypothetical protein
MPRSRRSRVGEGWVRASPFIFMFGAVYWFLNGNWLAASACFCLLIGTPLLLYATSRPTRCGVATRNGRPCLNPARGVLLGCHLHRWDKFWLRFHANTPVTVRNTQLVRIHDENQLPVWALWASCWATILGTVIGFVSLVVALVK